jgi:hypothetical protein
LSGNDESLDVQAALDIRRLGFKRWFERQLIESHVYLVTCLFCLILILAILEQLHSRTGLERIVMVALVFGGVALGIFSWDRYRAILFRALRLSERSSCEKCRAYARYDVFDWARAEFQDAEEDGDGAWLKVKCKVCAHEWTLV